MDWTKAKTILIIALIVANIFLVANYVVVRAEEFPNEQILLEDTVALLKQKDIHVLNPIPTKHAKMPVLTVEHDHMDPNVLQEKLWKQVPVASPIQSEKEILQMVKGFLKECNVWNDNVHLDRVETHGETVKVYYNNIYEGVKIDESYIVCSVVNGQIIEMQRYWLNPVDIGRTKKTTISASLALINFISEIEEKGTVIIEDIEMVYWLDSTAFGMDNTITDTAFPAWRITYNEGQIKHIPAYVD